MIILILISLRLVVQLQLKLDDPGEVLPDCGENGADKILISAINVIHAQGAQVGARSPNGRKQAVHGGRIHGEDIALLIWLGHARQLNMDDGDGCQAVACC